MRCCSGSHLRTGQKISNFNEPIRSLLIKKRALTYLYLLCEGHLGTTLSGWGTPGDTTKWIGDTWEEKQTGTGGGNLGRKTTEGKGKNEVLLSYIGLTRGN